MDAPVHSCWTGMVFSTLQKGNWVCLSEWGRCRLVSACGTAECGASAAASLVFCWAPEQRLTQVGSAWSELGSGMSLDCQHPVLSLWHALCMPVAPSSSWEELTDLVWTAVLIFPPPPPSLPAFATQGSVWSTRTCSICGKLSFTCKKCEIA